MTDLGLELMDITKYFVMLCQVFAAADFSYCLFVGLSAFFSFVFGCLKSVEIRRLTWPLQNIPLFYLQIQLGCFCCFGSLSTCTMKCHPINFAVFG